MANVQVVFYSMYGHTYQLAKAIEEGVKSVDGVNVSLFQVPELIQDDKLKAAGAFEARQGFKDVPVAQPDQLAEADAIIFGTPTRFGNMCAQMRNFLDQTTQLWLKGALIGKIGSVFISTGSQHGGQETTITSFHTTLFHHGMIVVGVPYAEQALLAMDQVTGGTPYGASTIAGGDGSRQPSDNEIRIAKYQGQHVAGTAAKLFG